MNSLVIAGRIGQAPEMRHLPDGTPAPDKKLIRDAIKSGVDVPGARLIASERVDIK